MELRQLESFFWIATLQSFTAAADHLHITQSAISSRMTSLEQELGTTLFDRSGRNIQLTAKGRELLGQAREILELARSMRRAAASEVQYQGPVRLGLASTVAYTWLPQLLQTLWQDHPGLVPELRIGTTPFLHEGLLSRELDLIVATEPIDQPDMETEFLATNPMHWIASTALPLPDDPVAVEVIAGYPIFTYDRRTASYRAIAGRLRSEGLASARLTSVDSTAAIVHLVESGLGIGAIPDIVVRAQIAAGRLRIVRSRVELPSISLFISYRQGPFNDLPAMVTRLIKRVHAGLFAD